MAKMVVSSVVYPILFLFKAVIISSGREKLGKNTCVFVDHVENKVDYNNLPCSNNSICRDKEFRITYINTVPYVYVWNNTYWGIDEILMKCCGSCVRYTNTILNNITELTIEAMEQSDLVFPILSKTSTEKLYGSHFLPYIHVPNIIYVTKNKPSLPGTLYKCFPIVILCIMLSVVSGFIAWLFETWRNKDEFPRPFLIGCFEGFWWAFISMTTVGYGDKTPKTVLARLYAMAWIMVGIIGFGILTGQLTGEIVKANSPPAPSMNDREVGVLRFRDHDTHAIVENGGRVVRNAEVNDFHSDVLQLIGKLQRDEIEGFVLDKWTLAYVMLHCEDFVPGSLIDFFVRSTTRTEMSSSESQHSYGILARDLAVFQYFEEFVRDAQDRWAIISEEWWVKEKKKKFGTFHAEKDFLFSPSRPLFKKFIVAIIVMIGLTTVFGILYELKRKVLKGKKQYKMTEDQ